MARVPSTQENTSLANQIKNILEGYLVVVLANEGVKGRSEYEGPVRSLCGLVIQIWMEPKGQSCAPRLL